MENGSESYILSTGIRVPERLDFSRFAGVLSWAVRGYFESVERGAGSVVPSFATLKNQCFGGRDSGRLPDGPISKPASWPHTYFHK